MELRLFDLTESDTLYATVECNRGYLREWLPWVDRTQSVTDIREFITRARLQFENSQGPQCGIWLNDELAGCIGCHPIDWSNRHCSIGYWVEETRCRQGIVTRSCVTMLEYLFGELGLHRVVIQCGTGNHKSCAIPQRLGFTREGIARQAEWVNDRWVDLVVWSMLAGEWATSAAPESRR